MEVAQVTEYLLLVALSGFLVFGGSAPMLSPWLRLIGQRPARKKIKKRSRGQVARVGSAPGTGAAPAG